MLALWLGTLADHDLDLATYGVTASMVYWADLLYAEPQPEAVAEASVGELEAEEMPEIGLRWAIEAEGPEAEFIVAVAAAIGLEEMATSDAAIPPPREPTQAEFEAAATADFELAPIPWPIKRRLMKIFLRDVHHYLFDAQCSPRPGETYKVQAEIRRRTLAALDQADASGSPHVVVSHSLGTVIAYDCLKRVPDCPAVDGLLTIGSPLGLSEVQDRLKPEWTVRDGFPAKLGGDWANVYDRLDPVAGFDPDLAKAFQRDGQRVIEDVHEPNEGKWRHSIAKYLRGPELRQRLAALLDL